MGSGESNTGHGGGLQGTPLHTRALQDIGAGGTIHEIVISRLSFVTRSVENEIFPILLKLSEPR